MLKHATNFCCARAELVCWTKWSGAERGDCKPRGRGRGRRNIKIFKICQKFKKAISLAKAPSHEKHFAPLDVRGLWHARPLPSILPFTTHGLRPRNTHLYQILPHIHLLVKDVLCGLFNVFLVNDNFGTTFAVVANVFRDFFNDGK